MSAAVLVEVMLVGFLAGALLATWHDRRARRRAESRRSREALSPRGYVEIRPDVYVADEGEFPRGAP